MPITIEAVEQARNNLVAAIYDDKNQKLIFDVGVAAGRIVDFLKDFAQNISNSASQGQVSIDLIEIVLNRLEDFHVLSTQYFVRIAAKYKMLLEKIDNYISSETEDFSLKSINNLSQMINIKKDWKNYEYIDTRACDAAEEFGREVATIVNNIKYQADVEKNSKLFAIKLQMFVNTKADIFNNFNALLLQQRTVEIPRMLQVSQTLIEKKEFIFIK